MPGWRHWAGQLPAAAVLLGSEVAGLLAASLLYDQAADPPDSNYTTLATAVPIDMTELDSLPDGPWKQYGQDWLMLLADETAESTSQNRAEGAAAAGDLTWESTQLAAASGFASDVGGRIHDHSIPVHLGRGALHRADPRARMRRPRSPTSRPTASPTWRSST